MGVTGLTSFLHTYDSSKYTTSLRLRNCTLVVDGHALVFAFYLRKNISRTINGGGCIRTNTKGSNSSSCLVGGDYISYGQRVREFFKNLKSCQITPIVIFDGCYEDNKVGTVYNRFQDYIQRNVTYNEDKVPGSSLTPVGMNLAFIEVLKEEGVLYFQTLFEADDTVAMIASRLNVPVLSNDSDFQLYKGVEMMIPVEQIEFFPNCPNLKPYWLVSKFVSMKQLCRDAFGFQDQALDLLPLLGILIGNDNVPPHVFRHLFPNPAKHGRIRDILDWMKRRSRFEDKLPALQRYLVDELKSKSELIAGLDVNFEEMISSVLDSYQGLNGETHIWNLLIRSGFVPRKTSIIRDGMKVKIESSNEPMEKEFLSDHTKLGSNLAVHTMTQLPAWFVDWHCKYILSSEALELFINKRIGLIPQAELPEYSPAQTLSIPIIQVTAGIMLGAGRIFKLVTRSDTTFLQEFLKTSTLLPEFGQLPTIFDPTCRNNGRRIILEVFECSSSLHQSFIYQWPAPHRFTVICLIYFLRQRPACISLAIGLILSILKPVFLSNKHVPACAELFDVDTDLRVRSPSGSSSIPGLIKAQEITADLAAIYEHLEEPDVDKKNYNIERTYHYSEFQCILRHGRDLNILLGQPFQPTKFTDLDSYLIYHIVEIVETQYNNQPREFIERWFADDDAAPELASILHLFLDCIGRVQKPAMP